MVTSKTSETDIENPSIDELLSLESTTEQAQPETQDTTSVPLAQRVRTALTHIKNWLLDSYISMESDEGVDIAYEELNKMLLENHVAYTCVEIDPSFLGTKEDAKSENPPLLFSLYKEQYEKYKDLIVGASIIDKIDMFLGPIEAVLMATGYESPRRLAWVSRIAQEFIKVPFAVYYLARTNRITHLGYWAMSEGIAFSSGFGRLVDVFPLYRTMAKRFVRDKTCEAFIDFVVEKYGEFVEVKNEAPRGYTCNT